MIPELLVETAEKIKKINDQILEMAPLANYKGTLRVSIISFGTNGTWEGNDDTVASVIATKVNEEILGLQNEKSELLLSMIETIENADY